jgi:threonine/homoserine/homoserine lactone efflux protein
MVTMPDLAHWAAFLAAAVVFVLIPGPSVLYVVAQGIHGGFGAARTSAAGLAAGDLVQVLAAAAGLSVVLASSATLFTVLRYAGAAYLVYLGLRRLRDRADPAPPGVPPASGRARTRVLLLQGFSVNALNPKTALFFLALLPQFVDPAAGPVAGQVLALGTLFVALGLASNLLFGRLGGAASGLAGRSARFRAATRYVSGGTLIGLGLVAAAVGEPHRAGAYR